MKSDEFDLGKIEESMGSNFDFDTIPIEDPLRNVPITGDVEKDSKAEVSALLAEFKKKDQAERAAKVDILDSEYWLCVCFQNRDQKEAFLKGIGMDPEEDKYLNGYRVAKKLGIELPTASLKFNEEQNKESYTGKIPVIRDPRNKKGGDNQ